MQWFLVIFNNQVQSENDNQFIEMMHGLKIYVSFISRVEI